MASFATQATAQSQLSSLHICTSSAITQITHISLNELSVLYCTKLVLSFLLPQLYSTGCIGMSHNICLHFVSAILSF